MQLQLEVRLQMKLLRNIRNLVVIFVSFHYYSIRYLTGWYS